VVLVLLRWKTVPQEYEETKKVAAAVVEASLLARLQQGDSIELWDAAFDAGLISFTADGSVLTSPTLSVEAARALRLEMRPRINLLTPNHEVMLQNHRTRHHFS
jgi:hypothetical protein